MTDLTYFGRIKNDLDEKGFGIMSDYESENGERTVVIVSTSRSGLISALENLSLRDNCISNTRDEPSIMTFIANKDGSRKSGCFVTLRRLEELTCKK